MASGGVDLIYIFFLPETKLLWPFVNLTGTKADSPLLKATNKHY